jgi:hypothetical protein
MARPGLPYRSVAGRCPSCATAARGSAVRSFGGLAHDLAEHRIGGIAATSGASPHLLRRFTVTIADFRSSLAGAGVVSGLAVPFRVIAVPSNGAASASVAGAGGTSRPSRRPTVHTPHAALSRATSPLPFQLASRAGTQRQCGSCTETCGRAWQRNKAAPRDLPKPAEILERLARARSVGSGANIAETFSKKPPGRFLP